MNGVLKILGTHRYDSRLQTLLTKGFCKTLLVCQFSTNFFYNDQTVTNSFTPHNVLPEPQFNRYNFTLELELVSAFYEHDLAIYRIVNAPPVQLICFKSQTLITSIVMIPRKIIIAFRARQQVRLEGCSVSPKLKVLLDQFSLFMDPIAGQYLSEGSRYLIKGYFCFGSSGAPYLKWDSESDEFKVNSVQSEACGLQLNIDGKRDNNFQYVNAIASPIALIEDELNQLIN